MNAPIAQEIKNEAARSLLERLWEKNALVRFFRYNASAKHGVPIDDRQFECSSPTVQPSEPKSAEPSMASTAVPVQPVAQPIVAHPLPVATSLPVNSAIIDSYSPGLSDRTKGALLALATLGGLSAAGVGGYMAARPNATIVPAQTVQQDHVFRESPLQFIEDHGGHLP